MRVGWVWSPQGECFGFEIASYMVLMDGNGD